MVKIISPYNYPFCHFDFMSWNPVQEKCYPYFEQDCNLIVSASVASGKTVIAEAIFGYILHQNITDKVVYVCPLKALGYEKYNDWAKHETFSQYDKVMLSSDEYIEEEKIQASRMIISTIESMNIKCRKRCNWIRDIKALVFDEAHLFNDEHRGASAESLMMNLSYLNPECRLICLSGTLSNCKEVATWLKKLNGKKTYFINSDWRPTKLKQNVIISETIQDWEKDIIKIVKQNNDEKILIFVHSKQVGEKLSKALKQKGIFNAFYNADLRKNIKEKILMDFKMKYSDLNVLIATNSLGAGINL